jgi:hypothetical protein
MTQQGTVPVVRAVGRAILGAIAGMCIGLFPGTLIIGFILHAVLRLGSPTQERVNLYFAISAIAGAITGAILGVTIGERELSTGSSQASSGVTRRLFHPLGLLNGLACGAIFGATFASLFVYSSHPTDAHDALVVTCIAAVLGGVGGGFIVSRCSRHPCRSSAGSSSSPLSTPPTFLSWKSLCSSIASVKNT